jgi:hypothetical protein
MARGTSGSSAWLYCLDCKMIDYPQEDKSTMHGTCKIYRFGRANDYVPPIRLVLMKLDQEVKISQTELIFFKLAIALHGDNPQDWLQPMNKKNNHA